MIITFAILSDYNINIRENELEDLKVDSKNDLLILNVVVIPEDIKKMTVNLAAPIVINARRGVGKTDPHRRGGAAGAIPHIRGHHGEPEARRR